MMTDEWKWEVEDHFRSKAEFVSFLEWLRRQVVAGNATEVDVERPFHGISSAKEQWFSNNADGVTWRLVWPDPPFRGKFEPVESE